MDSIVNFIGLKFRYSNKACLLNSKPILKGLAALSLLVLVGQPAASVSQKPTLPLSTQPLWGGAISKLNPMPSVTRSQIEEAIKAGRKISLNGQNLQGVDLSGLNLSGFDFSYANLNGANLSSSNLSQAILWSVRAQKANFSQANLNDANLVAADLSESNLQGATFRKARLLGTALNKANLSGSDLRQADLYNAILEGAIYTPDTEWPTGFKP